jgi:hypothetical protein
VAGLVSAADAAALGLALEATVGVEGTLGLGALAVAAFIVDGGGGGGGFCRLPLHLAVSASQTSSSCKLQENLPGVGKKSATRRI